MQLHIVCIQCHHLTLSYQYLMICERKVPAGGGWVFISLVVWFWFMCVCVRLCA